MTALPASELMINRDGSAFHLHLKPDALADTVLLVGDPDRVPVVSAFFDRIETQVHNREFSSATGSYKGKRLTVTSTGIGAGNVDIVLNELDALANIDFNTRTIRPAHRKLTLVRMGTSGGLQPHIHAGDFVLSAVSAGLDGLLNYYARRNEVSLADYEAAFVCHTDWHKQFPAPYFVRASEKLCSLFADYTVRGMTVSAPGFYAPQGRVLRLPAADAALNRKIESFRFHDEWFTNFEMESAAVAGLAQLLGHDAVTVCCIIANRVGLSALTDYRPKMRELIALTLEKLTHL